MRTRNFIIPLTFLFFALLLEMPLISSTLNLQVIKGEVSVVEQGEVTKIYASDSSIVTYHAFDIKRKEKVEIILPSEDSRFYILIDSNQPTEVKNQFICNGQVYLFNPHGIYLDKEASLTGHSFYLIGAEPLCEDPSQNLHLTPSSGDIVNHGTVQAAKNIHLIGRHVVNSGLLQAEEEVKISDTQANKQLSILLTGEIIGKKVHIEALDGICEVYGRIDTKNKVSGEYGGSICILAQQIRLIGGYLDASGKFGGGTVHLGGNSNQIQTVTGVQRTSIDHCSLIDVSAITYGPGGEVVVWSRELTSFDGEIYAQGGQKGGDGGLVITSSQSQFGIYVGRVNVEASHGKTGLWVLEAFNQNQSENSTKGS